MQRALLALIAALVLATPVLAVVTVPPSLGEPMLVVVPPWVDASKAVESADGWVIGLQQAPFGVLATSHSESFVATLSQNGAWAVLDGRSVAAICGVSL